MDSKNVILAVILSTLVLIVWATFFEPPVVENKTAKNQILQNDDKPSPTIEEQNSINEVSRSNAINNAERIILENSNIKGSISLQGAIIDDIVFKNYKKELESDEQVIFLNPKNSSREYFVETGWAASGSEQINLPLEFDIASTDEEILLI